MRDALLQARVVTADGLVAKAGGPTVKNVSGFDLCRLLVGSQGTLAFIGDVILRTRPRPEVTRWFAGEADPFALLASLYRPAAILWDATTTWVALEGHPGDVAAQAAIAGLPEVDGPPPLPTGGRASLPPGELRHLPGRDGDEVGVGVVHLDHRRRQCPRSGGGRPAPPAEDDLDPHRRLNPGRSLP